MAQQPNKKQVLVDVNEFIRTRDALGSAYLGLSASLDRAVKAYLDHTNVVLAGDGSLDVSHLLQPFNQLAETAQEALRQGADVGAAGGDAGTAGPRRRKRAYKQRDPNAPKRPQTAYFRYLNTHRPDFVQELAQSAEAGQQKPGDITKLATERWHAMTREQQQPYRDAYQAELSQYAINVQRYRAEGGDVSALEDPRLLAAAAEDDVPAAQATAEDDDTSDDDSDDSSAESEVELPPAPKTPSSKSAKASASKKAVTSTPAVATSTPAAAPAPTPSLRASTSAPNLASPQRKRKTAPSSTAETSDAKRSRKTKAEKADKDAAVDKVEPVTPAPAVSSTSTPVTGKDKKKKRKDKSEGK